MPSPPSIAGAVGGVFNVVLKSGANDLHGNIYEFNRNDATNARNPFRSLDQQGNLVRHRQLRFNNFGGTLGGPVILPGLYNGKDKTHFFFSWDVRVLHLQGQEVFTVPTQRMRAGDFSEDVNAAQHGIFDPFTTVGPDAKGLFSRRPFLNPDRSFATQIPANRIDPQTDPIVRVEASRLRAKLKRYYRHEGKSDPIRIEVPVGGYVPAFHTRRPLSHRAPATTPQRLAVLPFSDLSPLQDQDAPCCASREELIQALARLSGHIILTGPPTRRRSYGVLDACRVGEKLGADFVVDGSVKCHGGRVRVSSRLIDVARGCYVWAESREGDVAKPFAVQRKLSSVVAEAVRSSLARNTTGRIAPPQVIGEESYSLYLTGRSLWSGRSKEGMQSAIGYIRKASDLDRDNSAYWAGLADCYSLLACYSFRSPLEVRDEAIQAACKAVEIGSKLPQAYTSMGHVSALFDWDWPAAERAYRRALELGPGYAPSHHWYAITCLVPLGRLDQAMDEMTQAWLLAPTSPSINHDLGNLYYILRQPRRAIECCAKALELQSDFHAARLLMALALEQQERFEDAVSVLREAITLGEETPLILATLGHVYALWGKRREADGVLAALDSLGQKAHVSPAQLAFIYAGLGEEDKALEALQRAFELRAAELAYLKVDPRLSNLTSNPKFKLLLRNLGLLSAAMR